MLYLTLNVELETLNVEGCRVTFLKKISNVENLVEMNEKTSLWSVLKGNLPTRSSFAF